MKAPTHQRFSELQLALESSRGDLVRAFIREASLADGVAASVASLIADDTAHFERIGPNVAIELSQALRDVQGLGANSMQLSGPLGDPGLLLLTDAARSLGFFFCGRGYKADAAQGGDKGGACAAANSTDQGNRTPTDYQQG